MVDYGLKDYRSHTADKHKCKSHTCETCQHEDKRRLLYAEPCKGCKIVRCYYARVKT